MASSDQAAVLAEAVADEIDTGAALRSAFRDDARRQYIEVDGPTVGFRRWWAAMAVRQRRPVPAR